MAFADLNAILALSREMLEKAETGAWEDLAGLENRRAVMLAEYFEAIRAAGPDAGDGDGIRAVRELNERILELGKIQRHRLVSEMSDSSRQRQAVSRYRQNRIG
ncbi:MAG: flagellar protein FliT [Gammaproteobacteria bacterium]|nr:flagellar protein FliT [Gammaproteobacteria bacterium]